MNLGRMSLEHYKNKSWGIFRTSYHIVKLVFKYLVQESDAHKKVTESYPDPVSSRTADELPVRTRGLLECHISECTACGDCVRACPVSCIELEVESPELGLRKPISVFDIDFSQCCFCGICVEVCDPGCLKQTREFEAVGFKRQDVIASFGKET